MNGISLLILQLLVVDSLSLAQSCNSPTIQHVIGGFLGFLQEFKKIIVQCLKLKSQEKSPSPTLKRPASQQPVSKNPVSPKRPLPLQVPSKPSPTPPDKPTPTPDGSSMNPLPSSPAKPPPPPSSATKPPPRPRPTTPPQPSPPVGRPYIPPPPLEINPKHMSRVDFAETNIKWNKIKRADHYMVELIHLFYKDKTYVNNFPKNVAETNTSATFDGGPGPHKITVSAFRTSDQSILITKESSYIIVSNIATATMKITMPTAVDDQGLKAKVGDWDLEWEAVPGAAWYSIVVTQNKEVDVYLPGPINNVKITVTSRIPGRHDILLYAWKQGTNNVFPLAWGTGLVNVVDDD